MRSLATLALISLFLAGCASRAPDEPAPTLQLEPIPHFPIEADHGEPGGHARMHLHNDSVNMVHVGYHSGYGDGRASLIPAQQGYSELFVRDGLAFLGRRVGPDGGFVILDVGDPTQPRLLGSYQGLANYDMESTWDNQYVFFVSQWLNNQQPSSLPPDDAGEAPRLIHIVDISDRSRPTSVGAVPVPTRGVHTITYHRTAEGRELVTAQTYDFVPDPSLSQPVPGGPGVPAPSMGPNTAAQRVLIYDFVRAPEPTLRLLSTIQKQPPADDPLADYWPHDAAIQKHPVTGQLILYLAYWDLGGFLYDITDPANPRELSHITDFAPSRLALIHLLAPANALIDGMHVTVAEPELTQREEETGQYTFYDTTDPTKPRKLGFWTLPGELQNDQGTRFSPHNFEVEDGRLYLAHYHAGVWVVDVSNATLLQGPQALAYALPYAERTSAYAGDRPDVWTTLFDRGHIFASDMSSGLHVYRYLGDVIEGRFEDPATSPTPTS